MAALVCDKDELAAAYPCAACLSEHDLLAVIALALCKINAGDPNAACDPATLLANAACLTCLSNKQILEAIVKIIVNWAYNNGYMLPDTDLRADIACLHCLTPKQILAIILDELCTGVNDGTILCTGRQ